MPLEEGFRLFDLGHVRGARDDVNFAPLISAATRLPLSTEVNRSCSPQITSVGQVGVRSDGGVVNAICRRAATNPIEAACAFATNSGVSSARRQSRVSNHCRNTPACESS